LEDDELSLLCVLLVPELLLLDDDEEELKLLPLDVSLGVEVFVVTSLFLVFCVEEDGALLNVRSLLL